MFTWFGRRAAASDPSALPAALQAVDTDHSLNGFRPDWLEARTIPLPPTAIAAVSGWQARHSGRADLPMSQR
ncbi:hypothetical protein [Nonomuraea sp. NPDC049607]|uniref:hypothetical protein n=1 Tax=Nonomuraea sp. NPDC049607 TaxID=3154732 RepID=UPI00341ABF7E